MISLLFACRIVSDKQRAMALGMAYVILRIFGMDFWQFFIALNSFFFDMCICLHVYVEFQIIIMVNWHKTSEWRSCFAEFRR